MINVFDSVNNLDITILENKIEIALSKPILVTFRQLTLGKVSELEY